MTKCFFYAVCMYFYIARRMMDVQGLLGLQSMCSRLRALTHEYLLLSPLTILSQVSFIFPMCSVAHYPSIDHNKFR